MNKKLAAALSGGAVLMLVLSGCGGDDGNKVDDWAKTFCDEAKPQIQKRANANQLIISTAADSKPATIQAADSKAFADIAAADRALAKAVETAGTPPVENGETIKQDAVKQLNDTAAAYDELKKQVDGLDTSDQQKFADGLKSVSDNLAKIQNMDQAAITKLQSGELGQAMAKQPGCQTPKASVPPSPESGSEPAGGEGAAGDGSKSDGSKSDGTKSDGSKDSSKDGSKDGSKSGDGKTESTKTEG
ncbi:small secreted protein [Streptomyces sp. NPDC048717]|uniref:small secreted protein n=1 Tax=Streptomyces sp. NPDC048717 TaxID=3154928 RepID=UPI00342F1FDA